MRTIAGYRPSTVAADLLGLGLVAALLAAIHFVVPPSIQAEFVFRQSLERPETLLTAAYLHLSDEHLYGNLVGYALAAAYTYVLCLGAGQRRWFRFTTLSVLLVLPALVNLTSMVAWRALYAGVDLPPSRGFSGVVAGFGGFLAVALLVSLRQSYGRQTVAYAGQFVLLVVLGELLVIYAGSPPVVGGLLLALGIGLVAVGLGHHAYPGGVPGDRDGWLALLASALEVILVLVVLSGLVYGLFPVELVEDGALTNVFAHLSGLVWGAVVSGWGYRYWGRAASSSN